MTIESGYEPIIYVENGVTTLRSITWPFIDHEDLLIVRVAPGGATETTLTIQTDYTVTGGAYSTGTVTMASAGAVGGELLIKRVTPKVQTGDFSDNWPAGTLEQSLDRLTMIDQEQTAINAEALGVAEHVLAGTGLTKATAGSDVTLAIDTAAEAERIRDTIGSALLAGTMVTVTVNDAGDTITIAVDTATFSELIVDTIAAALVAGSGMDAITYNDGAGTITLSSLGGGVGGGLTNEDVRDVVATFAVAGSGVTITHNDAGDTLTFALDTATVNELARDALGTALIAGTGITKTVNDAGDTITIASSITQYTDEMARDALGTAMVAGSGIALTVDDAANTITVALASTIASVFEIPVLAGAMEARTTGGPGAATLAETAANKVNYRYLPFDPTTPEYAQIMLPMDPMWNEGTLQIAFAWTCTATGDAVWGASGCAISDSETLDTAQGVSQTVTDTIAAAGRLQVSAYTPAITLGSTPLENDVLILEIFRKANDAADTINAADAHLLFVKIKITTSERDDS